MKREIDIILDNLEELQALVQAMSQEKEIPSILFRFSYDKTTKIVSLLKELEQAQLQREEQEEQVKDFSDKVISQPVITPVKEEAKTEEVVVKEPVVEPVPEITPLAEEVTEPAVEAVVEEKGFEGSAASKISADQSKAEAEAPVDFGRMDELVVAEEAIESPVQHMDIEVAAESGILSDTFAANKDPYLAFEAKTTLNERIQKQLSTDFRKALSLNDRFRFTRELFNNDSVRMNECIDLINQATDFAETEQELLATYKWNKEQEEVVEFFSLIRQRFM